ncbi:MAG TPA: Hsp20/alpha crystallin family protein [Candidatus Polarisedimenticolaceae bacterium]|jgi:HSP20 family protein|nr:Hsp20/alpha crystallin family protein [Candidatus Polarisedimenticolaceae bacterium]
MAIQRWDPVRDLMALQERMNRLFDDAFARSSGPREVEDLASGGFRPPVDLFETADRYVLRVDLPGVTPGEVELQAEGTHLLLRGERKMDGEVGRDSFLRLERPYGPFALQIALPPSVDRTGIQAAHRDGVLEVTLPKRREDGPARIKVDVK